MRDCRLMIMRGWGPRTARKWFLLYPVVVVASAACKRCRRINPRAQEARGSVASELSLALLYSAAKCARRVSPNSVLLSRVRPLNV